MIHGKLPGGEQPGKSFEQIIQRKKGALKCRDCRQYCNGANAIRESRGRNRCPRCGGILDREVNHGA